LPFRICDNNSTLEDLTRLHCLVVNSLDYGPDLVDDRIRSIGGRICHCVFQHFISVLKVRRRRRVNEVDDDSKMRFSGSIDGGALDTGVFPEDDLFKEGWEIVVTGCHDTFQLRQLFEHSGGFADVL